MTVPATRTIEAQDVEIGMVIVHRDNNHERIDKVEGWFLDARPNRVVIQYGGRNRIHSFKEQLEIVDD